LRGKILDVDEIIAHIEAVTALDIQRVAQTYLKEENRTIGILIPEGAPVREKPTEELGDRIVH